MTLRINSPSDPVSRVAILPAMLQMSVQSRFSLMHRVSDLTFSSPARVRARRACLGAGVAFLDASNEGIIGLAAHKRMRSGHLLSMH